MPSDTLSMNVLHEVTVFRELGVRAFMTGRDFGNLSTNSDEAASAVSARWDKVRATLYGVADRLATSRQVHGANIIVHQPGWSGWLRCDSADGHLAPNRGTALGISVADCVPILIAHPNGTVAALHAGWRGIAAGILQRSLRILGAMDMSAGDLRLHLGAAICGKCYEVGRDVYYAVSGRTVEGHALLDLRAEIAGKAALAGVRDISISEHCTSCNNEMFYSHRKGDVGRQFAFIAAPEA